MNRSAYPARHSRIRLLARNGREQRVADGKETFTKAQELRSFLFLAVVMAPVLAVIFVSGYGFVVWMSQLIFGPPGN